MVRFVVKLRKAGKPWATVKTRNDMKALGVLAFYAHWIAEGKLSDLVISRQEDRRRRR